MCQSRDLLATQFTRETQPIMTFMVTMHDGEYPVIQFFQRGQQFHAEFDMPAIRQEFLFAE